MLARNSDLAWVAASATCLACSSSASARFRSMNWPTCPPTASNILSTCPSGSRISVLKNSITPRNPLEPPDAKGKGDALVHLHELLEPPVWSRPRLGAAKDLGVRINRPASAHHPVQALADRLKNLGHRLFDGPRLDQDAGGGVLGGEPALPELAPAVCSIERSGSQRDQRDE